MPSWPPINRDDLRAAAGAAGFDTVFPILVRRLIAETGDGVSRLEMPGGSGTAVGGFDGVVEALDQTTWVPAGTSVWELSVEQGAQAKATLDFEKRLVGPDDLPTSQVAYVAITLAPWTKSKSWAAERNGLGRWREVRAYNLDDIDTWLENAPATLAWLADYLGKGLPGVRSLSDWWTDTWLPTCHVPLDREVILAGRGDSAQSLVSLLKSEQSVVTVGGDLRPDELRAFVAAAITAPDAETDQSARALLVSDANSLTQLLRQTQPLVVVVDDASLAADVPRIHAHQLVMPASPGSGDVIVPPVDGHEVEQYLKGEGIAWDRAQALGVLARRSLSAARRELAVNPAPLTPTWARRPDATCRRLALAGGWVTSSADDRDALARLVGREYSVIQEDAHALAKSVDVPMLGHVGSHWFLLSPPDAWSLLRPSFTPEDLEGFRQLAIEALTEIDPLVGLDVNARFAAQSAGVQRRFSGALRSGLAQTLALIGGSEPVDLNDAAGPRWSQGIVRELVSVANADSSYALWMSLGDVLSLLAESAPEEFLEGMRRGLESSPPLHRLMFQDAQRDEFGNSPASPHTHFLWALETLAWSLEYLDEVVDVLSRLAALDPGGSWSNRPQRTLAEILSLWHPNTTADESRRSQAVRRVVQTEPTVGWQLVLDLIPDGHGFQTAHPGPRFRDWKHEQAPGWPEILRGRDFVVALALQALGTDVDRFLGLLSKFGALSPEHRQDLAFAIGGLGEHLESDVERNRIYMAIRELVARHREYSDTDWALPEEELGKLTAVAEGLAPRSPVLAVSWLFESDWLMLGDVSRRDDPLAYQAMVSQRRATAVGSVLDAAGLEGALELAGRTDYPYLVGLALGQHTADLDPQMLEWLAADSPASDVAFAYFRERLSLGGTQLRDHLLRFVGDPSVQSSILLATNDPDSSWALLPQLPPEVATNYWRRCSHLGYGDAPERVLEAAHGLMSVGRNAAALDAIALRDIDSPELSEVIAQAMEALLASEPLDPELALLSEHEFQILSERLWRHRDTVGRDRVLRLELAIYPALGFDARAPSLHGELEENPAFFAEVIARVYRPSAGPHEARNVVEPDAQQEKFDDLAYRLLRSWRTPPGVDSSGHLEMERLRSWVVEARRLLRAADRSDIGDQEIGQALSHAAPDGDGMSPPRVVRTLLEELRSDELDTGLRIGILNSRGVTTRGVFDGGEQERRLAEYFRGQADQASEWPRTQRLLRQLQSGYEEDARREDLRAEGRRQGQGAEVPVLDWGF